MRKKYWGFEPNNLPLNARVWFPKDEGLFPLVLIVHGNHEMDESSDPGYAYLGKLLASRGFIVASIDENFLNYSWSGNVGEENGARSWLLLKHLELWRRWNQQKGNPFYQRVDLSNIALIGHSRGGEAIVHAAEFNRLTRHPDNANVPFHFGFDIKTLIAIAPTSNLYRLRGPSVPLKDINYLVLQGSHDGDLGSFYGAATYRRIAFTGQDYRMKAALYIYRANHSQFNTVWGRYDREPPLQYLFNQGSLLSPQEQRTIAKVYVSAFLEATLHGAEEYIPLFRNFRRGRALAARHHLLQPVPGLRFSHDHRFRPACRCHGDHDSRRHPAGRASGNLGTAGHGDAQRRLHRQPRCRARLEHPLHSRQRPRPGPRLRDHTARRTPPRLVARRPDGVVFQPGGYGPALPTPPRATMPNRQTPPAMTAVRAPALPRETGRPST